MMDTAGQVINPWSGGASVVALCARGSVCFPTSGDNNHSSLFIWACEYWFSGLASD